MKILASIIVIAFFLAACVSNEAVSKEECTSLGLKFKKEKVLNYRTGKYELRSFCKQN